MQHRTQVIALGIVVSLAIAASPSTASSVYTISPGEVIEADILADVIRLEPGTEAFWGASVTLDATSLITIDGILRQQPGPVVHDLTLRSDDSIIISGSVIAGHGAHAADVASGESQTALNGADGGGVVVDWGMLGSFTLSDSALLGTGNGGHGGNVTVTADSGTPAFVDAVAGSGGDGGVFVLDGTLAYLYGSIDLGSGGDGGRAIIELAPNAPVPAAFEWNATGGIGGSGATAPCSPCDTDGGNGGSGGAACIPDMDHGINPNYKSSRCVFLPGPDDAGEIGEPSVPPVGGGIPGGSGTGEPGEPGAGADCAGTARAEGGRGGHSPARGGDGGGAFARNICNGEPGAPGSPGTPLNCSGGNGWRGGRGGAASATGGRGGNGGVAGGNGGDGEGVSGVGGNGGDGGDAYLSAPPTCIGGNGGNGGSGGSASGRGGRGGDAYCTPGVGGMGDASGGTAGSGGRGGDPGGASGSSGGAGAISKQDGDDGRVISGICG